MASLDAVANALAKTIEDYTEVDELYVLAYPADSGHLPAVVIAETGGDYLMDMGHGWVRWDFDVLVMIPRVELSESVPKLRRMLSGTGPESIEHVLFQHPGIGLTDGTEVKVGEVVPGSAPQWNSIPYIGATLKVSVITDGRA